MFGRLSRVLYAGSVRYPLSRRLALPGLAMALSLYCYSRKKRSPVPISIALCTDKTESLRGRMNFLADVCDRVLPSVVYIESRGSGNTMMAHTESGGSGFIIQKDGLVLTNAHVTGGAKSVSVRLHDKRKVKGLVVAIDQLKDLALIQLNIGSSLPALKLVSTEDLRAGEMVLALGSPLRLTNTITSGIVSQTNRRSDELGLKGEMNYIQTDAAIISGNSGGPLVNLDGEAIGINTLTAGPGVSFAIPSDYAIKMLEKLHSKNISLKPKYYLGVQMVSLTPQMIQTILQRTADLFPSDVTEGVLIASVHSHSPANSAGLQRGDVITQVNGQTVYSAGEVLQNIPKGKSLKLKIIRRNMNSPIIISVSPELVDWVD